VHIEKHKIWGQPLDDLECSPAVRYLGHYHQTIAFEKGARHRPETLVVVDDHHHERGRRASNSPPRMARCHQGLP